MNGLRDLLGREHRARGRDLPDLAQALLSGRGEASGMALADEILTTSAALEAEERRWSLDVPAERFGPDLTGLDRAVDGYRRDPCASTAAALHRAAEPRRQELFRRLNPAPGGTLALVRMREDVLRAMARFRPAPSDSPARPRVAVVSGAGRP